MELELNGFLIVIKIRTVLVTFGVLEAAIFEPHELFIYDM